MSEDPTFQFPADIEKAEKHRLANRIFKGPIPHDKDDRDNMDRCQCCGRRVGNAQHRESFCYQPLKDLAFLGPGVALLFIFIQNVIIGLLFFTTIFSIYSLVSNLEGNSCDSVSNCFDDIFSKLSLSNKITNNDSIVLQTFLVSGFIFAYFVLKIILMYRVRKFNNKCDEFLVSPSDYSIIIRRLPTNITKIDIEAMIQDKRKAMTKFQLENANKLHIAKIVISYDPQEYIRKMEEQERKFIRSMKKDFRLPFEFQKIPKPNKTGVFAIVVFQAQASKQVFAQGGYVKSDLKVMFMNCQFTGEYKVKGKSVIIQRAPEPTDIIWENAGIPIGRRYRNIILSYFFGGIILAAGGYIQYLLQTQQLKMAKEGTSNFYSYLSSLVLILENILIENFLEYITLKQGNQTQTLLNISLMQKTCVYQFLNTGILFLVAHYFAQETGNFDIQAGGFAFQLTIFMVINALQPTILNLITTKLEFPKNIKRYFVRNGYLKYTQKQANQVYEKKQFQYAIKYAYIVKTFWITLFYAPFVPSIVFISIIGIVIFYFTEKELLRTSYKIPDMVSIEITQAARRLLDYGGIILLAGQLLIMLYIKYYYRADWQYWSVSEIVSLSIAVAFNIFLLVFPMLKFHKKCFPMEPPTAKQNYQQVKDQFEITYEGANPYDEDQERSVRSIKRDIHEYRLKNQNNENNQKLRQNLIK